tara:strand:- start:4992 stop:5225 length:234 start_codon:yes stop_codon:yes gene_type:complete
MPQIGWFEILIVVVLSILIIGPKDFPIMLRKIGSWFKTAKNYFSQIQDEVSDVENIFDEDLESEKKLVKKIKKENNE